MTVGFVYQKMKLDLVKIACVVKRNQFDMQHIENN